MTSSDLQLPQKLFFSIEVFSWLALMAAVNHFVITKIVTNYKTTSQSINDKWFAKFSTKISYTEFPFFVNLFIIFRCQITDTKIITVLKTSTFGIANFSDIFCRHESDRGSNFRENWALIYWSLVRNQTLCFF